MAADEPERLRHIAVRLEDEAATKSLFDLYKALQASGWNKPHEPDAPHLPIPLDPPTTKQSETERFVVLAYAERPCPAPLSDKADIAYVYRYADVLGLVLAYHQPDVLDKLKDLPKDPLPYALGDCTIEVSYGTPTKADEIEDKAWKLSFLNEAAAGRALVLWEADAPPPVLRAQVWGFKLLSNAAKFAEFAPLVGDARTVLKKRLEELGDNKYLHLNPTVPVPTSALVPVQQAEAALALAESQLTAAATGARIAAGSLTGTNVTPGVSAWASALQQQAAHLHNQLQVEKDYNSAVRLASEALQPLARSIQALSQERIQTEQNRLTEIRNRLTVVATALTGFVGTLLAAISTFSSSNGKPHYWPCILSASLFVGTIPVIFGRWPEHRLRCAWVRLMIAATTGCLVWLVGSYKGWNPSFGLLAFAVTAIGLGIAANPPVSKKI
ncbi:MAG: hypothetical protein QM758_06705 [Armatimonas sp.]